MVGDFMRALLHFHFKPQAFGKCRRLEDEHIFSLNSYDKEEHQGKRRRYVRSDCSYNATTGFTFIFLRVQAESQLYNIPSKLRRPEVQEFLRTANFALIHLFNHFFGFRESVKKAFNASTVHESIVNVYDAFTQHVKEDAGINWLAPPPKFGDARDFTLLSRFQSEDRYFRLHQELLSRLRSRNENLQYIDNWSLTKSCKNSRNVVCYTDAIHSTPIVNKVIAQVFLNYACKPRK